VIVIVTSAFFEEQTEQSQVKATIVSKYFDAWAKVIIAAQKKYNGENRVAYIDLFAGPGRYKKGAKSTPIMILEQAIADPDLRERLVAIFNDADPEHAGSLKSEIEKIANIKSLRHEPQISNYTVGDEIVKDFASRSLVPTLFFVDPFGYKGLSLQLIQSVLKDWGCDGVFFFNYNRISMGVSNDLVKQHMAALFGEQRAAELQAVVAGMKALDRELAIVEGLVDALKEMGANFVLPFRFLNAEGKRTSHHLVFVSKAFKGYEIMKEVMASASSSSNQGVPSFEYSAADERFPKLFELSKPLDQLADDLLADFSGRRISMVDIYNRHNVGRPFIKRNYKAALLKLERAGKITASPSKRRKDTFADGVLVDFPDQAS
jgi:three-Cys-motif partner protein